MVRYNERADIESRFSKIEKTVMHWRVRITGVSPILRREFQERLFISLIYHDAALEGDVLSYSEIKAATDPTIISDSSLIPSYEQVKHYHQACLYIREAVAAEKTRFTLDMLRDLYAILAPEEEAHGYPYRKENPLHRLYYHEIVLPEQIDDELQALGKWLDNSSTQLMHPIELAVETHFRIMAIFPWAKESGRCARLASNLILAMSGYPLAVLHSIDRQAYYEGLREGALALVPLYSEALETAALAEIRVYDEAEHNARRRHAS